jgi:3-hydroxyisobutyrate dehydrogenase-like beta-hydroxyacid dehydrogenase
MNKYIKSLLLPNRRLFSTKLHNSNSETIGFIGLGHMGSKMVENMARDGKSLLIFDRDSKAAQKIVSGKIQAGDVSAISQQCTVVFSMLPNDKAVEDVSAALIEANKSSKSNNKFIHVSCSTISPGTSRKLVAVHADAGHTLITAPVFARPDGIAKRQATWMLGGEEKARNIAAELLTSGGNIVDMGADVGAANVVKLCGNFLIAVSFRKKSLNLS